MAWFRVAVTLLAVCGFAFWVGEARARSVDLIYAEPNVGNSSGGHLAVRFDDRVYHFQNRGGRWLRMQRVGWGWFQYAYGVLQNRDLSLQEVAVDDGGFDQLRDRFNEGFLIERQYFARLEASRRDVELLEQGVATGDGTVSWGVRGAGFFCTASTPSTALVRVRDRVAARYGAGALRDENDAVERAMRGLPLVVASIAPGLIRRDRGPGGAAPFSDRYLELAQKRAALAALTESVALCPEAQRRFAGDEGRLSDVERRVVAARAAALEDRLVALLRSSRPDWGDPLLLGLARLAAFHETLRDGRWVVLDAFPHDAAALPAASAGGGARRLFLAELEADASQRLGAARAALREASVEDERVFNDWEDASNRALELRRGLREERDIRVSGDRLVPEGWKHVEGLPRPRGARADLAARLARARSAETDYAEGLERLYRYDLFDRNCVTELFRTLDVAATRDEGGGAALPLGGRVDPDRMWNFVPAVAFGEAAKRYPRVTRSDVPSYRTRRLAEMGSEESKFAVFLRESNTVTSTVYRRNPHDSFFLFFTDDTWWPRPLLGAFNLALGLGESGWGFLRAPLDRGARLRSGVTGVMFSAPELFFLNFRKGTLEYGRGASARRRVEQPGS